jgi:hypothetical protein
MITRIAVSHYLAYLMLFSARTTSPAKASNTARLKTEENVTSL